MSKIELIASDLDGTLINSQEELSKDNIDALQKAYQNGIRIVLCSGRNPFMMAAYLREAQIEGYLIACNGAVILDNNLNVLRDHPIDINALKTIVQVLIEQGYHYSLIGLHTSYRSDVTLQTDSKWAFHFNRYRELAQKHQVPIGSSASADKLDFSEPIYKLIINKKNPTEDASIANLVTLKLGLEMTSSDAMIYDIMAPGISKGNALTELAEKLGIQSDATCVFGDYDNDISMFEQAGTSIAMGNALDHVKEKADYVTLTNDEHGVAHAINRLLFDSQN